MLRKCKEKREACSSQASVGLVCVSVVLASRLRPPGIVFTAKKAAECQRAKIGLSTSIAECLEEGDVWRKGRMVVIW